MTRISKLLLTAIFCLSLLTLSGCKTKVAYTFIEWIADWYIGSYVTLTAKQSEEAKNIVTSFHDWHRETQLPIYVGYVEGLKQRLSVEAISGTQIHQETDKIQVYLDQSADKLLPSAARLMSSLSDGQVEEIMSNLEKERRKYQRKYVDIPQEKAYQARIKELKRNTKRLFGRLTEEQDQWVSDWAKQLQPYEQLTLKQQELMANKLLAALHQREDTQQLENTLKELLFYRTDNWDLDLQKRLDFNQQLTYQLLARIINNLSPKQSLRMNNKLDQYVADFTDLSRINQRQLTSR